MVKDQILKAHVYLTNWLYNQKRYHFTCYNNMACKWSRMTSMHKDKRYHFVHIVQNWHKKSIALRQCCIFWCHDTPQSKFECICGYILHTTIKENASLKKYTYGYVDKITCSHVVHLIPWHWRHQCSEAWIWKVPYHIYKWPLCWSQWPFTCILYVQFYRHDTPLFDLCC